MMQHGTRLRKGGIAATIEECSLKHDVPCNVEIRVGTVKQRLKWMSTKRIQGQSSPMEHIEPYIVSIIIQLANVHLPITVPQGFNSIVAVTKFKE